MTTMKQYFPDTIGQTHIWIHSDYDSMPKTHKIERQTKSQHGGRHGNGHIPIPRWEAISNWHLLRVRESVFFKNMTLGRSTLLQGLTPHSRVFEQHKFDLIDFYKRRECEDGSALAWRSCGRDMNMIKIHCIILTNILFLRKSLYWYGNVDLTWAARKNKGLPI